MAATQAAGTKQTIRQKAQKLFRERGYAGVGLRELAKEAGIQAPSLYNHYKSKDDLLREICFDIAQQFFSAFDAAEKTEIKSVKKLKAVVKAHLAVIAANLDSAEVFFNEWVFLEEPNLSKFKKLRQEYEMKFRAIIDKGIRKGDFKKMNSKLVASAIFSALNAAYELYRSIEKMPQQQIAEDITDLLLKGLKS